MTGAEGILSDQGVLGAGVLILLAVCGALWKRLTAVQDARLDDVKSQAAELATVARDVSRSMDGLRQVLEARRDA